MQEINSLDIEPTSRRAAGPDLVERNLKGNNIPFTKKLGNLIKRLFDVVASFIGLLLLSPIFALIGALIKRDTPGPVFFWCPRMGKGERPFNIVKFRTMYERESSYQGARVTCKDDERITPFGRWLRDTKINELPQLWNVLVGEMSLVGPRPEDVEIAQGWSEDTRREVLSVRPGITSPASILYYDEENQLSKDNLMVEYLKNILPDKIRLDRLYVRNQSFSSDLDIIFWTLVIFIPKMMKVKIPEGYLFAGPISSLVNRFATWFLVDLITSLAVVGVVGLLWRFQDPLNWGVDNLALLAIILAMLFNALNSISGLNRIDWTRATVEDGLGLVLSCMGVTAFILALNLLQTWYRWFNYPPLPIIMIVTIGLIAQMGFIATRYRLRLITSFASRWLRWRRDVPGVGERVIIIGAGEGCQTANWLLKRAEFHYAFTIVGVVDDDIPTKHGMRLDGCLVLGRIADLPALIGKNDVGLLLFTIPHIAPEVKEFIFNLSQKSSVRLAFLGNLMEMVSQQLSDPVTALEYSLWSEDQLKYLALHDFVTGLPNRYLFQDRLVHCLAFAKRYKTNPAVIFICVDGFLPVDDTILPRQIDTMMKEMASRLLHFRRESDTLARLDTHEFGLILEHISDENAIVSVAKRISSSISEPFCLDGRPTNIHADISYCSDLDDCANTEVYRSIDIAKYYNNRKLIPMAKDQ